MIDPHLLKFEAAPTPVDQRVISALAHALSSTAPASHDVKHRSWASPGVISAPPL
jgi:hypothetical protein